MISPEAEAFFTLVYWATPVVVIVLNTLAAVVTLNGMWQMGLGLIFLALSFWGIPGELSRLITGEDPQVFAQLSTGVAVAGLIFGTIGTIVVRWKIFWEKGLYGMIFPD